MTDLLRHRCELLVGNREIMRQNFKRESIYLKNICALIYAAEYSVTDVARIKESKKYIKSKTGRFSSLRSYSMTAFAAILAVDPEPEARFDRASRIMEALDDAGFMPSQPLAVAAMLLSAEKNATAESLAGTTRKIYDKMSAGHLLSSVPSNDIIIAAAITLAGIDVDFALSEFDESFGILNEKLPARTARTLAGILTLDSGNAARDAKRLIELRGMFSERGYRFGRHTELSVLSVLSIVNYPEKEIVNSVIETCAYLKKERGFGFVIGKKLRLMYSAVQVFGDYVTVEKKRRKPEPPSDEIRALRLAEKAVMGLLVVYGIYIDNY